MRGRKNLRRFARAVAGDIQKGNKALGSLLVEAVTGILLAAGSSRRFGADKRWHRLADGRPMVLHAAERLAAACSAGVVVVRPDDAALRELLAPTGLRCVVCERAADGMGHSLAAGVAAAASADGWLVALADMPFIAPRSYSAVIDALGRGARIARPVFRGEVGHPVGFSAPYRDALLALTGDAGARSILRVDPEAVCLCPVDDAAVVQDIDQAG